MRFSACLIMTAIVAIGFHLPAQESYLEKAGLTEQNYEDIESFLTARNSKIRAATAAFTASARKNQKLPKGVMIVGDETINIEGRHHPSLLPVHYVLLGYLGFLERDSSSKRYQEALIHRGFPANEMPHLVELSKSARSKNFFSPKLAKVRRDHKNKLHSKLTKSQVRTIVEDFSRQQEIVYETWALKILQELTPPARRVLILVAFETIGKHLSVGLAAYPASNSRVEKTLLTARDIDMGEVQK